MYQTAHRSSSFSLESAALPGSCNNSQDSSARPRDTESPSKQWCGTLQYKGLLWRKAWTLGSAGYVKRRKQYKMILTLEMIGNLRTLLHSLATCIHHVHREDGYGGAPHETNWKKTHRIREGICWQGPSHQTQNAEEPTMAKSEQERIWDFPFPWISWISSALLLKSKS